jgi:hypothetical protein
LALSALGLYLPEKFVNGKWVKVKGSGNTDREGKTGTADSDSGAGEDDPELDKEMREEDREEDREETEMRKADPERAWEERKEGRMEERADGRAEEEAKLAEKERPADQEDPTEELKQDEEDPADQEDPTEEREDREKALSEDEEQEDQADSEEREPTEEQEDRDEPRGSVGRTISPTWIDKVDRKKNAEKEKEKAMLEVEKMQSELRNTKNDNLKGLMNLQRQATQEGNELLQVDTDAQQESAAKELFGGKAEVGGAFDRQVRSSSTSQHTDHHQARTGALLRTQREGQ